MPALRKQWLLAALTVAALCAAAVWWVSERDDPANEASSPVAVRPSEIRPLDTVAPESQPESAVAGTAATKLAATTTAPPTAQELSDQLEPQREQWRRARGLLPAEVRERYRALSDDELRKLVAAGDVAAMTELARRLPNTDEGSKLQLQAEIRGSVEPAVDSIRAAQRALEKPNPDQWQAACMSMWSSIFYLELVGYYEAMSPDHVDPMVRARCESTVMSASQMYSAFWTAKRRLVANNQRRAQIALPALETQGMPGNQEWFAAEDQRLLESTRAANERFRARFPNQPIPSATQRLRRPDGNGG